MGASPLTLLSQVARQCARRIAPSGEVGGEINPSQPMTKGASSVVFGYIGLRWIGSQRGMVQVMLHS